MKIYVYGDRDILKNYSSALNSCGAEHYIGTEKKYAVDCKGLLLAGGGDINPRRYGKRRELSYDIDIKRDYDEIELIKLFLVTGRPILGICRGIQIINVALNGSIIQDVENRDTHKYNPMVGDMVHDITAKKDSFLHKLYGERFCVNSAHHQAIGDIGELLTPVAYSDDGIIEAVECESKRIYGVQFHPERMAFDKRNKATVDGRHIFDYFISKCR